MLSIESPQLDPPCPCLFPHLKSGTDERASHKLPLPEVDPPLDHHHHTPLPNFSIRDYVFTARSKDIKKNWPFSLKNLQLCLKHGVHDPLPPFQNVDTVRNQSIKTPPVETSAPETKTITIDDEEPRACAPEDNKLDDAQSNHKLPDPCIGENHNLSSRSAGEHDFPSSTTSVSHSEIEWVSENRPSSSSPLETDTLLEASAARPPSRKAETTTRPPGKKCRLVVKFGANSDRSSTEDIASNCTALSETMASKTCPVCKTFSSSSNTTLNAHIDQCLSAESTPKWTANSRLTRPRIKLRKTRLMTDIYATAKPCTLEELDRRNGTNWAAVSSLPAPDTDNIEVSDEEKTQRVPRLHPENAGDVGPVYIDANGTKLRILSKLSDTQPASEMGKDLGVTTSLKTGGKGSQFLSTKKKIRHGKKHYKYLKLASQSRKYPSQKAHASQVEDGQGRSSGVEENFKSVELQTPKQINPNEPGTLRQWVCSKRTGLVKKLNKQGCKWHATPNLPVDNNQSSLGDSPVTGNQVQKLSKVSKNPFSSSENCHKAEKPFCEAQISEMRELSSGRKRVGSPVLGTMIIDNMERSLLPLKRTTNILSNDVPSVHDRHTFKPPDSTRNIASSLSKRKHCTEAVNHLEIPPASAVEPSMTALASKSNALRCPSTRKTVSFVSSRSSVIDSRSNVIKKLPTLKKTQLHCMAENGEQLEAWKYEMDQQYASMHGGTDNNVEGEEGNGDLSFGRGSTTGIRKDKRPIRISRRKEIVPLRSSQLAPQCYGKDKERNSDSSVRVDGDYIVDNDSPEPVGGTVTCLMKARDARFHNLSNHSKIQSHSSLPIEDYSGYGDEALRGPTESFVGGREMYCGDEVGNGMVEQTTNIEEQLDPEVGQGNSFPEVDPIPIPGPPGSFLPSPRDMGSDDLPGNSSLTTSRVQSSQDQFDFIDGDSSESPVSVASTILNSSTTRSDLKYSEPLSSMAASFQDKITSGFSAANVEQSVDTAASALKTCTGAERSFGEEKFMTHKISVEKKPFSFKNDGQPCCCQRKERFSQGIALNCQESQLLRRRTMASVAVPATGNQMGLNPNTRPDDLDKRPEMFSLSSCPSSGSGKVVLPVMKPPADSIHMEGSPDARVKFVGPVDSDSASPSASNPILRLMGKNLMVVNKEEDASTPLGQAPSSSQNRNPTFQFPASSSISPGNLMNQDRHSFHHMVPQGSLIFGQNPHDAMGQYFDVRNNFRNHANLRAPETPVQVPAGMFLNQQIDGGFTASVEPHKYEGAYNLSSHQTSPKSRLGVASSYSMEKVITTLDSEQRNADSTASIKEIIVIDDPDSEVNLPGGVVKYSEGLGKRQVLSCDMSIPGVHNYNPRHQNPFPCYHSLDHPLDESSMAQNNNFHAIPSRRANASPVRWGCTSEGAGVLHRGTFISSSSSASHLISALYYSPSLS